MIRTVTRPSNALCTLSLYIAFLLTEPKYSNCCRLAEVMSISHDSINRFLGRENFDSKDLFNEAKEQLILKDGVVSVDDTVLDKPYSNHQNFVGHYWSGKHHKAVKGINIITLYYTDIFGNSLPINYRIYDKSESKTKNDYFLEMLTEIIEWGVEPSFVTGDSWYSSNKNLKTIKNYHLSFLFAIKSNRKISVKRGELVQVQKVKIPKNGLIVWLNDYGYVKVFRMVFKEEYRHYIVSLSNHEPSDLLEHDLLSLFEMEQFLYVHNQHWKIEEYHRTIKQVCHIEDFQVRSKRKINNHIYSSLCAYIKLKTMCTMDIIDNCYKFQRNLFDETIRSTINWLIQDMNYPEPQYL